MITWLILLLWIATGFVLWGFWIEPNWFRLRHETVRLRKPLSRPLTILHLSDFHFVRRRFLLSRFFDQLAKLEPDFIFLTGDFIDELSGIEPCMANLRKLKAKQGIYAVFGNHDYRIYPPFLQWIAMFKFIPHHSLRPKEETEQLKETLEREGIQILINQNISIQLSGGEKMTLIGVDDPVSRRADLDRAFQGATNGSIRVALAHSPTIFPSMSQFGIDLAFAGHTHGGQIRFPGFGPIPNVKKSISQIVDSTNEFGFSGIVCRGLGAQDLVHPRLFCRPEAILVRIEGADRSI